MVIKNVFKGLIGLLVTVLLFFVGEKLINWMNQSSTLNLNDVIVNGTQLLSTDEIIKLIPAQQGRNITNIDLQEIQISVETHPYVEEALVSRKFPSALRIDIIERMPVAFISGTKLYAVDKKGVLLPRVTMVTGLPIITGIEEIKEKPGIRIESDRILEAIELFNLIRKVDPQLYKNLSEVHYDKQKGFLVYFNDARFPSYFGFKEFYDKAQKLQAFFQRIKEEDRYGKLKYVDLRFHEQVVAKF